MENSRCIKVSIIIPVYNAGNRLTGCLDSLAHQSLKEIEVILVLDCPTDSSDKICYEFAQKDPRFKIIENKQNSHIGITRNNGLKAARGEYIGFCDDDDKADEYMYETLYNRAKQNDLDVVLSSFLSINDKEQIIKPNEDLIKGNIRENVLKDLLRSGGVTGECPVFTNVHPNLYRKSFLTDNNITFIDTRKAFPEDRAFNIACLLNPAKVEYESKPLYKHYLYAGTESTTQDFDDGDKWLRYNRIIYNYLIDKGLYKKYEKDFFIGTKIITLNALSSIFFGRHQFTRYFQRLFQLQKTNYIKKAFRKVKIKRATYYKRRIFDLFTISILKF